MKRLGILIALSVVALAATAIGAGALSIDPGGRLIRGNLEVQGHTGLTGIISSTMVDAGTVKAALVDAGNVNVVGRTWTGLVDAGAGYVANNLGIGGIVYGGTSKPDIIDAGRAYINGPLRIVEGLSIGHCTLNGASPAVCTDTIEHASVLCLCALVGATAAIANMDCAVGVSGTTLTITSANAANAEVNWVCF